MSTSNAVRKAIGLISQATTLPAHHFCSMAAVGCCFSVQALVLGFVVWGAWLNCNVTALEGKKNTQVDKIRALFL